MAGRPPSLIRSIRPGGLRTLARLNAALLLAAPCAGLLWVGSYAHAEPRLIGIPFFYWYQLLWVLLSSCMTWCAYLVLTSVGPADRGVQRTGHQPHHDTGRAHGGHGR